VRSERGERTGGEFEGAPGRGVLWALNVPATNRSGDRNPQKHISKEGDEMLRRLLVGSAHYILGPFGSDSDLRRHGEKLASRGGKNAKKRAVVAVARKLAVLLHSLWVSGEAYDPLYNAHRRPERGEAA
jgi:transposase